MLDYFREFQVLATHLNFTTAANELGLSQSCLSRHIAELESDIGFKLMSRGPVALTVAGQRYLAGVGQAFAEIDKITEECRQLAKIGPLSIVVASIQASDLITSAEYRVLSELHREYPTLTHRFDENRKLTIRKSVEAGEADIGILCHEPADLREGFTVEWLFDNPFGAIMHRDDPLAKGPVKFSDISDRFVVFSTNRRFTTWVEGMRVACERYGATPQFRMKDVDNLTDFLISMQPGEVVFTRVDTFHPELTNPNLVAVPFSDEGPHVYPNYLIYPTECTNPAVHRFIDLMHEESRRLREAGLVL